MMRRALLALPVVLLFVLVGVVFMAARAPRTWAAHWTAPATLGRGAGANTFAVASRPPGAWSFLWVDSGRQAMVYTAGRKSTVLDRGEVTDPTLLHSGDADVAAWIRNRNGGTDLVAAITRPHGPPLIRTLIKGPQPIENPYLFAGTKGRINIVFSWQRYGNFEVFLLSLQRRTGQTVLLKRLERSRDYGFYPRAVTEATGSFALLHLESCCKQEVWQVMYERFTSSGVLLGRRVLYRIAGFSNTRSIPAQWAEDLQTDSSGNVWGAFAGNSGALIFEADLAGRIVQPPALIDPMDTIPGALALVVDDQGGELFWEQVFDLGTYIDSRRFDRSLNPTGDPERIAYESATESQPYAFSRGDTAEIVWEAAGQSPRSSFQIAQYRGSVQPSLAQRLGLGLGNPWQELAILLVSASGMAVLTTMMNIIVVFILALLGMLVLRLLRRVPGRWGAYVVLLGVALFLTFVKPGGPILFLSTIPSLGLAIVPFGIVSAAAAGLLILWMGAVALRRVEDLYRVGLMAILGVYFYAFLEALVFVQQRIGYI